MGPTDYLLPRPPFDLTPMMEREFDALWHAPRRLGWIDYQSRYPKWMFLSFLCSRYPLTLHGSQNRAIAMLQPRQAEDKKAFSNQRAIYATTDGIWVIFFAMLNRRDHPGMNLFNSCLQTRLMAGKLSDPLYFFSITQSILTQAPWSEGAVYILSRRSFQQEAPHQMMGAEVIFPHWISTVPIEPEARLSAGSDDFPFLAKIHGHNDEKLVKLAAANPDGFPWPEALES